jgi:hypothetical protein
VAELGKTLIIFGICTIALGILLVFSHRLSWLGRLPGDILIQRKNVTFYFPVATSIILSILLSIILRVWSRR